MNGTGEKPSSLWKRLKDAAGAKGPQQPAQPPAPTPEPTTPPPSNAPEPPTVTAVPPTSMVAPPAPITTPEPKAVGNMSRLVDQINDKIRLAKLIIEHEEVESAQASKALDALQLKMEELEQRGGDDDDWNKLVNGLKREQQKIDQWMDNVNAAQDLPKEGDAQHTPDDIAKIASGLVNVMTKNVTVQADLTKAGTARRTPPKALTKALAAVTTTPPAISLTKAVAARHTSAPIFGSGQQTALHYGLKSVAEAGKVAANLEQELNTARERINRRVLEIFDVLDKASARLLNEEAYEYKEKQVRVVPVADLEAQLERSRSAMDDFADIVSSLPQMVENLKSDLTDSESRYGAIAQRRQPDSATAPQEIPRWDRIAAARLTPSSPVQMPAVPQIPAEADLVHGAGESADVHGYGANAVREIKERKSRIDAQTITILNTINEILSHALGFEDASSAYAYEYDSAAQKNFMKVTVDTWAATQDTANALIPAAERLVGEIEQLIAESHQAKEAIARTIEQENNTTNNS